MSSWEPIQELRVGELRFHPDGIIALSGEFLPAEAAIEAARVGSVIVQKDSGLSAEIHISDGNGQALFLRFEDGHWWKRGHLDSAKVTPMPAVHSKGLQFPSVASRAPKADMEEANSKAPSTAVLLATGVLVLFALYLVREPLRLFFVSEVEHNRSERVQAEEAASLNAMRSSFNGASDRINVRMKEVQDLAGRLGARFREVIGMELAQAIHTPSDRPREVDTMILRSPAFSEAWTAVLNARPPDDLEKSTSEMVARIEQSVQGGFFSETNKKELTDLEASLASRKRTLAEAIDHLASMEHSLRAERFEENRRNQERRQP